MTIRAPMRRSYDLSRDPSQNTEKAINDLTAWTYQEARLSERLLIFTNHELYFESRHGNHRETVEIPIPCLDANLFVSHRPLFDPWNAHNPEYVHEAMAEYSSRELSRQEDALLAALGFLKEFRNGPNPVYHHWGVPIFPDQAIGLGHGRTKFPWLGTKPPAPFTDQGFLLGLCWRPAGDHLIGSTGVRPTRRPELPSWSWAGWNCSLDPKPQTVYDIQQFHAHPEDRVYVQCEPGTVPLRRLYDSHTTGRLSSHYIYLNANTISLTFTSVSREDMTLAARDQYPEPYALMCEGVDFPFCYGGWGGRTDSFLSLIPAQELMERLTSSSQSLVGIFLGRFEDKKDWPYGKQFILVICQALNGSFERVGHIYQGDQRMGLNVRDILETQMKRERTWIR